MSKHSVTAGDIAGLVVRFAELRRKAEMRTGKTFPIVVIQEAGLDGFWIHRVLQQEGIESHVVDPASIAVPRRRRRAKTDKIDGEALLRALLAYKRGEPRVCSMVVAPSPEDEDRRRLCRERDTLTAERVRHVNRIKGLLFAQGIADYAPLSRNRRKRLDELCTGDGRPLPQYVKAQISRELDRLELVLEQIKVVEKERDRVLLSTASVGAIITGPEAACDNPTGASGVAMLTGCEGSVRMVRPSYGRKAYRDISPIAGRLPPIQAWRRHHGRAAASRMSRACRKRAIRGCARRWWKSPGCGCSISRNRRWHVGISRGLASAPPRRARKWRSQHWPVNCSWLCGNILPPANSSTVRS